MIKMPSEQILQTKADKVEETKQLLEKHKVIGMADLRKVRAPQLQHFKKNLAGVVYLQVIKNSLMKRAVEKIKKDKPELKELMEHMTGTNIYLFTDLNPFKLVMRLNEGKVRTTAKSGDIAAFDVVIPAGSTGQPPGPIISQLNAVGLPTRIESGSVSITKDTLVVEEGNEISERLASVLSKLGIKPVEAGLQLKVVYDDGFIIPQDLLQIDLDKTKHTIKEAHTEALVLSLSVSYPTNESINKLLQIAHREAYALAISSVVLNEETIGEMIRKAHMEMMALNGVLSTIGRTEQTREKDQES
jgi:large subunit ribosomal protein L10